eukprot:CAMPEP_0174971194 /NCGR_PEP_ID=MMETSP0004_2-20121128/9846_1 /TAXON_ID=420556 /ORGANISM="Ochromonas sp., Strain CCMP1393" /LENGTH=512 /DNA_ID=CAMNT_0016221095 /DNA_START=192 /DNA_END=1730 /DNA_ORIENTATION=+
MHARSFTRFATVETGSSTNGRVSGNRVEGRRVEKFGDLLKEIRGVIRSPGMTRNGIARSFQIAKALNRITLDYINEKEKFQDDSGKISIPKSVRKIFEEFGATYIKLGQFIASSPTIFPAEYVTEFQTCLDRSPTVPYSTIKNIIEKDLGKPISAVYSSVDPVPLASASIAQVHRAKLKDGTEVVIKVRKPGVDSTLEADLGFLLIASKLIEFISPSLTYLSLSNIVEDIRESMLDELDFRKEVANINNFRAFLTEYGIADAVAPLPYPEASGVRVLTMEYLKGVPLVDLEGIKEYAESPEGTLVSALRTWALTVSLNDKFHADVHAGNLLVLEDGRIGFIDFGIVGKISDNFRSAIGDLFDNLVTDNFEGVAKALVQMGATNSNVDIDKFARELQEVVDKITSMQPEITIETDEFGNAVDARLNVDERETTQLVLEVVNVAENNGLKLPREFGLILKQALYFDRYQKLLAPAMDPLRDATLRESFNDQILSAPNKKGPGPGDDIIDVEIVD